MFQVLRLVSLLLPLPRGRLRDFGRRRGRGLSATGMRSTSFVGFGSSVPVAFFRRSCIAFLATIIELPNPSETEHQSRAESFICSIRDLLVSHRRVLCLARMEQVHVRCGKFDRSLGHHCYHCSFSALGLWLRIQHRLGPARIQRIDYGILAGYGAKIVHLSVSKWRTVRANAGGVPIIRHRGTLLVDVRTVDKC